MVIPTNGERAHLSVFAQEGPDTSTIIVDDERAKQLLQFVENARCLDGLVTYGMMSTLFSRVLQEEDDGTFDKLPDATAGQLCVMLRLQYHKAKLVGVSAISNPDDRKCSSDSRYTYKYYTLVHQDCNQNIQFALLQDDHMRARFIHLLTWVARTAEAQRLLHVVAV